MLLLLATTVSHATPGWAQQGRYIEYQLDLGLSAYHNGQKVYLDASGKVRLEIIETVDESFRVRIASKITSIKVKPEEARQQLASLVESMKGEQVLEYTARYDDCFIPGDGSANEVPLYCPLSKLNEMANSLERKGARVERLDNEIRIMLESETTSSMAVYDAATGFLKKVETSMDHMGVEMKIQLTVLDSNIIESSGNQINYITLTTMVAIPIVIAIAILSRKRPRIDH
ncbi:hypothetical protein Pdsh_07530 [Pyrodictium delaneyi]|uniref:Uncharacterized protein n=1 Tax=Pyrodictium delaneyi TaxID=1273541 RepID=A0A211YMY9_9CREN|nr:hypothetical protein Pdsh_07530 [Pyrodictium delaneyi]